MEVNMPSTVKQALLGASVVVGMVVFLLAVATSMVMLGLTGQVKAPQLSSTETKLLSRGGDGLLAQGSPAVQENVCRAIARAAEVTLSRYAAAFELQLKLAEWSRRASISV